MALDILLGASAIRCLRARGRFRAASLFCSFPAWKRFVAGTTRPRISRQRRFGRAAQSFESSQLRACRIKDSNACGDVDGDFSMRKFSRARRAYSMAVSPLHKGRRKPQLTSSGRPSVRRPARNRRRKSADSGNDQHHADRQRSPPSCRWPHRGAIGVSGMLPTQDAQVAQAGAVVM